MVGTRMAGWYIYVILYAIKVRQEALEDKDQP